MTAKELQGSAGGLSHETHHDLESRPRTSQHGSPHAPPPTEWTPCASASGVGHPASHLPAHPRVSVPLPPIQLLRLDETNDKHPAGPRGPEPLAGATRGGHPGRLSVEEDGWDFSVGGRGLSEEGEQAADHRGSCWVSRSCPAPSPSCTDSRRHGGRNGLREQGSWGAGGAGKGVDGPSHGGGHRGGTTQPGPSRATAPP